MHLLLQLKRKAANSNDIACVTSLHANNAQTLKNTEKKKLLSKLLSYVRRVVIFGSAISWPPIIKTGREQQTWLNSTSTLRGKGIKHSRHTHTQKVTIQCKQKLWKISMRTCTYAQNCNVGELIVLINEITQK